MRLFLLALVRQYLAKFGLPTFNSLILQKLRIP